MRYSRGTYLSKENLLAVFLMSLEFLRDWLFQNQISVRPSILTMQKKSRWGIHIKLSPNNLISILYNNAPVNAPVCTQPATHLRKWLDFMQFDTFWRLATSHFDSEYFHRNLAFLKTRNNFSNVMRKQFWLKSIIRNWKEKYISKFGWPHFRGAKLATARFSVMLT